MEVTIEYFQRCRRYELYRVNCITNLINRETVLYPSLNFILSLDVNRGWIT